MWTRANVKISLLAVRNQTCTPLTAWDPAHHTVIDEWLINRSCMYVSVPHAFFAGQSPCRLVSTENTCWYHALLKMCILYLWKKLFVIFLHILVNITSIFLSLVTFQSKLVFWTRITFLERVNEQKLPWVNSSIPQGLHLHPVPTFNLMMSDVFNFKIMGQITSNEVCH